MRLILAIVAALGLASCDADQASLTLKREANKVAAALNAPKPPSLPTASGSAGSPDAIAVVTNRSVPEYHRDLEHCQTAIASSMGPRGEEDSLEALKRALREHPHDKVISPVYVNDDRAIRRRESVKTCLSNLGYLVVQR